MTFHTITRRFATAGTALALLIFSGCSTTGSQAVNDHEPARFGLDRGSMAAADSLGGDLWSAQDTAVVTGPGDTATARADNWQAPVTRRRITEGPYSR